MDIWSWVSTKENELREMGHGRLATLMSDISTFTCNEEHSKVDLIYPEALALAKNIGDKWVELFLRHWYLQSQVLHRNNARGNLTEAIDLLDFSHQDDTKECPQRICVVQDLTNCYSVKDGPGFVEERIAVAEETLATIDASWSCYRCIGSELIYAHLDAGDAEKAHRVAEELSLNMAKHMKPASTKFRTTKADILIALDRLDEAEEALGEYDYYETESTKSSYMLTLAEIYAKRGEWEKAAKTCISYDDCVRESSNIFSWIEIQSLLIASGHLNLADKLLYQMHDLANILMKHGAARDAVNVYAMIMELSLEGEALFSAKAALYNMERAIPELNKDLGASQKFHSLQSTLQQRELSQQTEVLLTADELLNKEFGSFNQEAAAYELAYRHGVHDSQTVINLSQIYEHYHLDDAAQTLLREAYQKNEDDSRLEYYYGLSVLEKQGRSSVESLFPISNAELSEEKLFYRLWLHFYSWEKEDPEQSYQYIKRIIAIEPPSVKALHKAYTMALDAKQLYEAKQWNQELLELEPENKDHRWDQLVLASLLQDWPTAAECARSLDIKFDETRPINEQEWESIRVLFNDHYGNEFIYLAKRTGPATATITGIVKSEYEQRYKHQVVFDPYSLNTLDCKDDEGYSCDSEGYYTRLFKVVGTLAAPTHKLFTLDGVHPSEEGLEKLRHVLSKINVALSIRSSDEYEICISGSNGSDGSEKEEYAKGIFAYLLVPEGDDLLAVHTHLQQLSNVENAPLVWLSLVATLGLDEEHKRQEELARQYNLE